MLVYSTPPKIILLVLLVLNVLLSGVHADCRLVAIGDIHGDKGGAIKALHTAKVVDQHGAWIGGCTTLVQTGDIVDRGAESLGALKYFRELGDEAAKYGGEVVMLLGNHEMINFEGSTEYVNPQELRAVGGRNAWVQRFGPQGSERSWMKELDVVATINNTVFVHAGLLPSYAALGESALNRLARLQLKKGQFNFGVLGENGPTWTRRIIMDAMAGKCHELELSLSLMGASRMVVGHTIQMSGRIGKYCKGQLLAIDIAISRAIKGNPGCIELTEGGFKAFYANGL